MKWAYIVVKKSLRFSYAYSTSNDIENRRSDTSEKKLTLFRKGYFMRFVTYR
ncbi:MULTISPECIES: hypothetical protein [Bacillus cereus group]|uniref:Uncharacterized protein n=1 Tax=Bacillus cereus TaxID=1396 RepID=A0A161T539_BACCE|nr:MULTISPECIES: hypothetical protein [Bacillus cereus group]KZD65494.1 hypothetical protein B4088_2795 [Bacillus cereus]